MPAGACGSLLDNGVARVVHRQRWHRTELVAETRRFFRRNHCRPRFVRVYFGGPHALFVLGESLMSF